jgi:hypothetical protein
MNQRRRTKELEAGVLPRYEASEEVWRAVQAQLDREMNALPEKYRIAIVLCDLEGKTIKDAAQQVGWPQGTMATRLARGRAALAQRLRDQGLVLSAGVLAAVLSGGVASANVPAALVAKVVEAAGPWALGSAGIVSAKVVALSEGVVQAMFISKLKSFLVAGVIALAAIGFGSGFVANRTSAQDGGGPSGLVPLQLPKAPAQPKLDDDPVKLKKEIERLRAELARTKLELQIARQEAQLARNEADLARAKADLERLQREVDKVQPLPFGGGGGPKPKPKTDANFKSARVWPEDPRIVQALVGGATVHSPVGGRTAAALDKSVFMIDGKSGKLLFESEGHAQPVGWLAFSPDGKLLVSSSRDKTTATAIVWDAATGKQLHKFQGPRALTIWQFSVDGRRVIASGGDGSVAEYDLQTGQAIRKTGEDSSPK